MIRVIVGLMQGCPENDCMGNSGVAVGLQMPEPKESGRARLTMLVAPLTVICWGGDIM